MLGNKANRLACRVVPATGPRVLLHIQLSLGQPTQRRHNPQHYILQPPLRHCRRQHNKTRPAPTVRTPAQSTCRINSRQQPLFFQYNRGEVYDCTSANKQLLLPKCTTGPRHTPAEQGCFAIPGPHLSPGTAATAHQSSHAGSTCGLVRIPKSARRSPLQDGEAPNVAALFDQSHAPPSLLQLQASEGAPNSLGAPCSAPHHVHTC